MSNVGTILELKALLRKKQNLPLPEEFLIRFHFAEHRKLQLQRALESMCPNQLISEEIETNRGKFTGLGLFTNTSVSSPGSLTPNPKTVYPAPQACHRAAQLPYGSSCWNPKRSTSVSDFLH